MGGAKNPPWVADEQVLNKLNKEENKGSAPSLPNSKPKPSAKDKQDPRVAAIEKWAWEANPKAVFNVSHEQELAEAVDHLQQQHGRGLDKVVKQAVRNRSAAMNAKESEMAGHLIAVNLLSDVNTLLLQAV